MNVLRAAGFQGVLLLRNPIEQELMELHVGSQLGTIRVRCRSLSQKVSVGDWLTVKAAPPTDPDATVDIFDDQLSVFRRNHKKQPNKAFHTIGSNADASTLQKYVARSRFDQFTHKFMMEHNFLPVMSPSIVSDWPDGNTTPFALDFNGADARLSISNMLYHQMMISSGFSRIYELGKLFRKEHPSNRRRLAEFTIIDISIATPNRSVLMSFFEEYIKYMVGCLSIFRSEAFHIPKTFEFDTVDYDDLIAAAGVTGEEVSGAQLPRRVRNHIAKEYSSFLWVTGFPPGTRPFYTAECDGKCDDFQLWFKGINYIAAGGLTETDYTKYIPRMRERGQKVASFSTYLSGIEYGQPPVAQIGMGVERFLACLTETSVAAEFGWFPRYGTNLNP